MSQDRITELLTSYGEESRNLPVPNRDEKVLKILEAHEQKSHKANHMEFILGQLGVLGRHSLIWELVWLFSCAFLNLQWAKSEGSNVMILISVLSPMTMIIVSGDLSRIMTGTLLEIEATTKYSVSQILLFRVIVNSLIQLAVVFAVILFTGGTTELSLMRMLLYGYTPYLVACVVLLLFISRLTGIALQYAGTAISVLLAVLILAMEKVFAVSKWGSIFDLGYWEIWCLVFGTCLVVYLVELTAIGKGVMNATGNSEHFEML